MDVDITPSFVCIDDFCKLYEKNHATTAIKTKGIRNRKDYLLLSEMMFIEVYYHFNPYKDFKHYCLYGISIERRDKFNKRPAYQKFITFKRIYNHKVFAGLAKARKVNNGMVLWSQITLNYQ